MTTVEFKNFCGEKLWSEYEAYMSKNGKDAEKRITEIIAEDAKDFDAEYTSSVLAKTIEDDKNAEDLFRTNYALIGGKI